MPSAGRLRPQSRVTALYILPARSTDLLNPTPHQVPRAPPHPTRPRATDLGDGSRLAREKEGPPLLKDEGAESRVLEAPLQVPVSKRESLGLPL